MHVNCVTIIKVAIETVFLNSAPIPAAIETFKGLTLPRTSNMTQITHWLFMSTWCHWSSTLAQEKWIYSTNQSLFFLCSHTVSGLECDSVDVSARGLDVLPLLWTWQMDCCGCSCYLFIYISISSLHPQFGHCILYDFMWVERHLCQDFHLPILTSSVDCNLTKTGLFLPPFFPLRDLWRILLLCG